MGGWMDGWMDGWIDGWVVEWVGGWVGGWMDGWMGGIDLPFIIVSCSFSLACRYLGSNRLRSLPDDALDKCQLETLDLSFNHLSAPPGALAHTVSIVDL